MKRKTILISGYFGFGNLGDEAILEAVVGELIRFLDGIDHFVFERHVSDLAYPLAHSGWPRIRTPSWVPMMAALANPKNSP